MSKYKGSFFVILSAVIFGLAPLLSINVFNNGGDASGFVVFRSLFSLPLLFVLMKREKSVTLKITKPEVLKVFLLSLGNVFTAFLLINSYLYIESGTATTVHFIYPILVIVACIILFKEPVSKVKIISVILCVFGIIMFYEPSKDGGSGMLGLLLAFLSGISYGYYVIYLAKSGLQSMNGFKLMFYMNLSSFIVSFLYVMLTEGGLNISSITPIGWVLMLVASNVLSAGYTIFQFGVKDVGPQTASILSTFEPITSVIVGILIFKDPFGLKSFVGIAAVLVSVVLVTAFDKSESGISH